jgi:tetratricopeptide (TPR) repeat protein
VSELASTRWASWRAALRACCSAAPLALALAALVLVAGALADRAGAQTAAAQPVKGEASATFENGFVRLVFNLTESVDSTVRLANGIVIITFARPVAISVDKLAAGSGGYITAARRDPDGTGIRLAVARKVTMNSMAAAERLFVDILPDTWSGLPPGLPREVIEALSQRARDADKKLREQRALVRTNKMTPVRVRVARQPTFTRYVFDLPTLIGVVTSNDASKLTLTFDSLLKFDLADARATLPAVIGSIDTDIEQDSSLVRFGFLGKVDVRTFRENLSYVVDVTAMDAKASQAEAKPSSAELSAVLTELAVQASAMPTDVEAPQTVPAAPPLGVPAIQPIAQPIVHPAGQPAGQPAGEAREAREAREAQMPREARMPSAPAQPQLAAETRDVPSAARSPAARERPAARSEAASSAPAADPRRESPAQESVTKESVAKESAANAAVAPQAPARSGSDSASKIAAESEPAVEPGDVGLPVKVVLKRQGDNLSLIFPFAGPTPAAIFTRADALWLVFDGDIPIDLGKLEGEPRTIKSASLTRRDELTVVRIKLERPRLVSAVVDGPIWTVTVGDEGTQQPRPVAINRITGSGRSSVAIAFDDPRHLHRLQDPDAGDVLLVVTGLGPARGLVKKQDFVEFRALVSTHGVVLAPIADDLTADLAADKIVVSRPAGLSLSAVVTDSARPGAHATYAPRALDVQGWGFDRQAEFGERSLQLLRAAADAPPAKRFAARADLARFYLARDMGVEAKAVLDVALADNPATAEDSTPLVLRAIAEISMGRLDEALKELNNPLVGHQHDAPLWRALIYARQGKWSEAHEGFRSAAIGTLPLEMQRMMLQDMVRTSLEVGDITGAVSQMHEFEAVGIPHELEPALAVLNGRIAEALGHNNEALLAYQTAADSWDRPSAAQGRLREVVLQRSLGTLGPPESIDALETLTAIWRGDDTEVEALALLSHLYTGEGRYRDSFHIMRTALAAHPNSSLTQRIRDEAAQTFDGLFLAGKGDTLPPIDALGLFYDFRDLTPIGRRGDEMIRRLADRLVAVDLLDQAAEMLQHQVDHRLVGAARAQVASRLAFIYLMNRKPDRALAALRATRSPDFSSDLRNQRLLLEARALSDLGRHEVAFEVVANIPGPEAVRLRADVLWAGKRWGEAAEQMELLQGKRWRDFAPLNEGERRDILRAAVGYVLADDSIGIGRLREKYAAKMGEGPDHRAFEVVTGPLDPGGAEFREIARRIASVDTLSVFLGDLRARFPDVSKTPATQPRLVPTPVSQKPEPATTGTAAPRRPTDPAAASPLPPVQPAVPRRTASR